MQLIKNHGITTNLPRCISVNHIANKVSRVILHEASCGCGSIYLPFSPLTTNIHIQASAVLGASLVSGSTFGGGGLVKVQRWLILPPHSLVLSCQPASQPTFSAQFPSFSFHLTLTVSISSLPPPPAPYHPPFIVAFSSPRNTTTTLILIIPATMDRALDDVVRERSVGSSFFCVCWLLPQNPIR